MLLDHRKLLAGDPPTAQLFSGLVRQWARKFFRKRSQIHGVSQSAMIEMIAKLRAGDIPEPGRTIYWALTCANNAVRRELTNIRKHETTTYESHVHVHGAPDPSTVLRHREDLRRVAALLDMCNQGARELLEARVRGSTYEEIAAQFQLDEGTARKSVSRLRKQLAEQLTTQDKLELLRRQVMHFGLSRHQSMPRPDSSASA